MKSSFRENKVAILIEVLCGFALVLIFLTANSNLFTRWSVHYTTVHSLLEFITILISFMTFTLGWSSYGKTGADRALLLSTVGFVVGSLDVGHVFSYQGMPDFFSSNTIDKPVYFWLVARWSEAILLLLIPLSLHSSWTRRMRPVPLLAVVVVWVAAWYTVIVGFGSYLPPMLLEGGGLTEAKRWSEFAIMAVQFTGAVLFLQNARGEYATSFRWMATACLIKLMGESLFAVYQLPSDVFNLEGHIFKAVSAIIMYRAVLLECIARPLDNLSRSELEARADVQLKSKILTKASHELRTPLVVICGGLELLLKASPSEVGPTSRLRLETMARHAKQLRWLIDELLNLSKLEAGRLEVHAERVVMADFLQQTLLDLQLASEGKGVRLEWSLSSEMPQIVQVDPFRLRQLFDNVVGNAIKFTLAGSVVIKIEAMPSTSPLPRALLKFTVTDTGVGIEEKYVKELFKPFSQGDPTISRRFGGSGLGLSFSRELARLMGGDLWLERSGPGEGSTFAFTVQVEPVTAWLDLESETSKNAV